MSTGSVTLLSTQPALARHPGWSMDLTWICQDIQVINTYDKINVTSTQQKINVTSRQQKINVTSNRLAVAYSQPRL